MNKKQKPTSSDYVIPEVTEEVYAALGAVDEIRLTILRGAAQRLGRGATLAEAIAFYEAPEPNPPPERIPPSRRK